MHRFVVAYRDERMGSSNDANQPSDAALESESDSTTSDVHNTNIFKPSYVQLACEYLVSVMGQSAEPNATAYNTMNWQTSIQAEQLCEQLSQTLSGAARQHAKYVPVLHSYNLQLVSLASNQNQPMSY